MQVGSPLPCRVQSQSGPKPALGWRRGIPWYIKTRPHTPTTTKAIRIVFIFGIMAHVPRAARVAAGTAPGTSPNMLATKIATSTMHIGSIPTFYMRDYSTLNKWERVRSGSKCEILIPSSCLPCCLRIRTLLDPVRTSHLCQSTTSRSRYFDREVHQRISKTARRANQQKPVQPRLQKYFCFLQTQITGLSSKSRALRRGVGHRHERWARDAVDAAASSREGDRRARSYEPVSDRHAQDERRGCVRQSRVVLAPVAGVKSAEAQHTQPGLLRC
jgi:hypothetical protein